MMSCGAAGQPGRAGDGRVSGWGMGEPWQPPQLLEPPSTPACDPGKLRLIEDAEDWQPRTGTSQSRSFRKLARLTGTDGSKFAQDTELPGCVVLPGFAGQLAPDKGWDVSWNQSFGFGPMLALRGG
ncbi:PDZ and LIM domain protein 5-like [Pluvialis apricaria]